MARKTGTRKPNAAKALAWGKDEIESGEAWVETGAETGRNTEVEAVAIVKRNLLEVSPDLSCAPPTKAEGQGLWERSVQKKPFRQQDR